MLGWTISSIGIRWDPCRCNSCLPSSLQRRFCRLRDVDKWSVLYSHPSFHRGLNARTLLGQIEDESEVDRCDRLLSLQSRMLMRLVKLFSSHVQIPSAIHHHRDTSGRPNNSKSKWLKDGRCVRMAQRWPAGQKFRTPRVVPIKRN